MRSPVYPCLALFAALSACRVVAQPATPTPARLPVKEVTVFKDGHAFVLHSGKLPVSEEGTVLLDHLPVPVLGTFWPYSADPALRLSSVTASPRQVKVERPATSVADLLEANPGAEVRITQGDGKVLTGKVVGIPAPLPRDPDPGAGLQPGGGRSPLRANSPADTLLLKTAEGVVALPLQLVQTVTFKGEYRKQVAETESRNLLTLKLERTPAEKRAEVGLFYLQKGIRWIPNYRVDIDGKGNATVELQATLINEMVDLDDVTTNLVIGVPNFFFTRSPCSRRSRSFHVTSNPTPRPASPSLTRLCPRAGWAVSVEARADAAKTPRSQRERGRSARPALRWRTWWETRTRTCSSSRRGTSR
jgi:hypothetical protein